MPTLKHLKCQVVDSISGESLKEWSQQTVVKDGVVSCFIQADTGRPFAISVTPEIPFPPVADQILQNEGWDELTYGCHIKRDHAPWHLLGTLRFDGRAKWEARCLIYLDKNHKYFKHEIVMDGARAPDEDGNLWWHKWIFNEVGLRIDTMLEQMLSLETSGKEGEAFSAEEELVGLMGDLDSKCEVTKQASKAGLLEITFDRCTVAEKAYYDEWRPEYEGSQTEDAGEKEKAGKDISHAAATDAAHTKAHSKTSFIQYNLLGDDKPYASFQFKYRSEEVLRKLNITGFPKKAAMPEDALGKIKLEEPGSTIFKGNKRLQEKEEADQIDSPTKLKRAAIKSSKDDDQDAEWDSSKSDYDGDDEETEAQERPKIKDEEAFFFKWKESNKATELAEAGDSDKENQEMGEISAKQETKKGIKGLQNGETVRLDSALKIIADMNGDPETPDSDNDDDDEDDARDMV